MATGALRWCRIAGLCLCCIAPLAIALQLGYALAPRDYGGKEGGHYMLGLAAAVVAGFATLGPILFEYSRLRSFELAMGEQGS